MDLESPPSSPLAARVAPEGPNGHAVGSLLAAGRNCGRIENASRVAFLVDGEEYFGAIRAALAAARHSFFILGWDIDSRMHLVPRAGPLPSEACSPSGGSERSERGGHDPDAVRDGLPGPLGDFLNAIIASRHGLRGYVLTWDFAMLYALEREWMPVYKLDWRTHRRLSFRLDDQHPPGASQHQKLVVVDDAVAFVSGYDLTRVRWDTTAHRKDDPRRVDHTGAAYAPFHDVGMMVAGDCARALGELARERWHRATAHRPRRSVPASTADAWPASVSPALTDVRVAIARTEPAFDGRPAVSEIRSLYLDAIDHARRVIFAENQYFTSRLITDAFARRLRGDDAPEIAVISPFTQSGWLEISTMGVLRARNHRALRAADRGDRYRLYSPTLPWLAPDHGCLNVHSKVLVVDDDLVMIGSANLADRSLGTDTECNLAIESNGEPRLRHAIAALRERLLAEHLDCTPDDVAAAIAHEGSVHRAITALTREGARSLRPIEPSVDPALDAIAPDHGVLDPEQPLAAEAIVADLVTHEDGRVRLRDRLAMVALALLAAAALVVAWRYTPLRDWLALDRLVAAGEVLQAQPLAPAIVVVTYVIAGLVGFPLVLLVAATVIVLGPWWGGPCAMIGAVSSAAVTFAIGRHLSRESVRRLAGPRLNDLSQRLAKRGLPAVVAIRILPIAPFSIVNVVAGATHIRWSDFLLGTAIGLFPGIVTASIFVDRAAAAIREPGPGTFAALVLAAAAIVALVVLLRRALHRRRKADRSLHAAAHGS